MEHSCGTLLEATLAGHSCRTHVWASLAEQSCRTLLWDTLVGHSCRTLSWDTLVGHSGGALVGHSCRALLWDTLVACRTLLWGTLVVGLSRRPLLWDTLAGDSCRTLSWHGRSCRALLSGMLTGHCSGTLDASIERSCVTLVGHSCRILEHSCGQVLWNSLVGQSYGTIL